MADAAGSKPIVAAEFAQSASDGIAIQTGDTRHQGDATVALLLCQQADQLATTTLINPSDQPVESAMLPRRFTVRMATGSLRTHSNAVPFCRSPGSLAFLSSFPGQNDSSIAILPEPAEVIFAQELSAINDSIPIFDMDRLAETPFFL